MSQTVVPSLRLDCSTNGQHTKGKLRVEPFQFVSGATLPNITLYFETWGQLNATHTNAVLVCHALTGDAGAGGDGTHAGWWSGLIGPGALLDTRRDYVVCANVLGGCAGSTGPSSIADDGRPYALRFPLVTVRDIVSSQRYLMDVLDIPAWKTVIGGSLGGMQVWEWAVSEPERVLHAVPIAAHPAFPPLAIGYNEAMRQAIVLDPNWLEGNYYRSGRSPKAGLATARAIGMLTYRTGSLYQQRFARTRSDGATESPMNAFTSGRFQVESYLRHHGDKLNRRFDANSYLYLTRAMDEHDIGQGRGGVAEALRRIRGRLSIIGIEGDYLYDPRELQSVAQLARECGVTCHDETFSSPFGHDAFLAEPEALAGVLRGIGMGVS